MTDNDMKNNGDLKLKLDELLVEIEEKYGPVMLEELTSRLEKTITQFNNDINTIFEQSFNKTNTISKVVSDSISSGNPPDLSAIAKDGSSIPKFLSEKKISDKNTEKSKNSNNNEAPNKKKKRRLFSRKK